MSFLLPVLLVLFGCTSTVLEGKMLNLGTAKSEHTSSGNQLNFLAESDSRS
ncbi:hypothetical protein [Halalkalibacterium halodurans]|uniref:hypothetical protein n=1 Tax=Halalkalibacterium halodurans TaxID=86665 RepID=UPI002E24BCBB|nr:hypothetical protein [Halalkalibacterium halodurans]